MPGRLVKIAANKFNSVRYQPTTLDEREALYQKLVPDPNWYGNLKSEVARLNAEAINTVGSNVSDRKDYLRPLYRQAIGNYPQYNSVYLKQPELQSIVPITRDVKVVNSYQPGLNGFIGTADGQPYIAIDNTISPGRQTKTIIHELAHNQMGHVTDNSDISTPIQEFQAEAIARGVRERLGMLSPNDQTASATYIAGHLLNLAGSGITPGSLFATHGDAIQQAVNILAPAPAQPFRRMVPQLYQDFE